MAMLEIHLFGSMQIILNGELVHMRPAARMLLAYLILHRNELGTAVYPREMLIEHFWGHLDEKQARRCLSTTLWRLRRELETAVTDQERFVLSTASGGLGFNFDCNHWIDVVAFEDKIQQILQRPLSMVGWNEAQLLEEARKLYCQDLLAGSGEDWVYRQQERLSLLYVNSLSRLMHFYEQENEYEKGLDCAQEILTMDPLREHVHRYMMRVYMQAGRRTKAVQQYHLCQKILVQELGIQPMPETQILFTQISTDQPMLQPLIPDIKTADESIDLNQLEQSLGATMLYLEQVQRQLSQVRQTLVNLNGVSLRL